MKYLVLALFVFSMCFAGNRVASDIVVFANIQSAADGDTLGTGDTMACVIDQIEGSVLSEKMSVHLPDVLASGDSCLVYLQELPSADANKRMEIRNSENQSYVADQAAAPRSSGAYVYNSRRIGTYYYGDGAKTFTWSPHDTVNCPRVRILIKESAGYPVILEGCDSLAVSKFRVTKLFAIE